MVTHKRLLLALTITCNILLCANVAYSAANPLTNNPDKKTIFDKLVRQGDVLDITITTDLKSLIEERRTEDFLDAKLIYQDQNGNEVIKDMEVQPRGKFRRRVCDFPPVKLKFPKKKLEAAGLNREFNDLKLVTHCVDDKGIGNEYLLREYLAYQLYSELTPNSYRVQLVKITYEDSEGKMGKIRRYGFIIEDTDEMAARVGGLEFEQMNVSIDSISAKDESIMALFQYMIGNADFNMVMLRNVKLVKPENGGKSIPVPYDFDFSGLVNTSYAIPQGDIGLTSIRDRLYLGNPVDQETMRGTLGYFLAKKSFLLDKVDNFTLLSRDARLDITNYLKTFFENVEPAFVNPDVNLKDFFSLKNASMEALKEYEAAQNKKGITSGYGK